MSLFCAVNPGNPTWTVRRAYRPIKSGSINFSSVKKSLTSEHCSQK